ncbi:MAG: hypothetical protein MJ244_03685, partial [Clostridia bacterium]|nr:hypothetical protein [Clostridia bacterium]
MKRKRITMTKRILVAMLCLVTIFTCIPMSAFADEASENVKVQSEDPLSVEEEIETTDDIVLEETLEEVTEEETLEEVPEEISEEIIVEQQEEIIEEEIIDETLNDVTESEASELPEENLPSPIKSKMLAAPLGEGETKVYNIYVKYVGSNTDLGLYSGLGEASEGTTVNFYIYDSASFPINYISVRNSKNEEIIKFYYAAGEHIFTMPDDDIYINIYKLGYHYIYTKSEGAGQVMASTSSAGVGETFTVTQQANNGSVFDYFEVDGTKYYESPLTLTMGDHDITVVGHFRSLYSPTVSTSVTPLEAGTITITGDTTTPGSICDVKVTANPGYKYDRLVIKYGNNTVTKTSSSFPYIIPSTNNNITFTAYFKEDTNVWNLRANIINPEGGKVSFSKDKLYEGETCRITVTPNDGWKIKSETWKED